MTFDFNKLVTIGFDKWKTAPFKFYGEKEPFFIGNKIEQDWRDIILHGDTALTLVNAKADSLEYLKLFGGTEQLPETYLDSVTLSGGCEQSGTPTPSQPIDIVCNNGAIKVRNKSGLPWGYQAVEYLESTGTQYINTGYKPNNNTSIDIKFSSNSGTHFVCGSRKNTSGNDQRRFCLYVAAAKFNPQYGNTNYTVVGRFVISTVYQVQMNKDGFVIDGITEQVFTSESFTGENNLILFGNNTDGTIVSAENRVYYFKIYDNDTLVRNLIPCRRNSDNVLGMYDLVSNVFLTNQGTGDFIAGADVDDLEIYTDGTQEVVTDSVGNTASAEMLLSVGDYKDTQEVISGSVTRNVGIKVLDGTEGWEKGTSFYTNSNTAVSDVLRATHTVICTHYQGISTDVTGVGDSNTCKIGSNVASNVFWGRIYIYADRSLYATGQDFANYLAQQYANGTPVTIVYPLETATTSTVTGQFLSKSPVTQTAGSISNLPIAITESAHTVPTPQQPLQINCNNGVVKVSKNLFDVNSVEIQAKAAIGSDGSIIGNIATSVCLTYLPVKPNTTYTISGDVLGGTTDTGVIAYFRLAEYTSSKVFIIRSEGVEGSSYTFTTGANTYFVRFHYIFRANLSTYQLEVGSTATPYMPYGQIYVDGTTETVEITGKNLFNKDDDTSWGGWYSNSGAIGPSINSNRTAVIRCKPNTKYYFKHCTYIGGLRVFYTEVENWQVGSPCSPSSGYISGNPNTVYSITTSANAKWLFVLFGRRETATTFEEQASDYILSTEVLTSDTPYEPYFDGGSATAQPLYKVGTYQDVQNVIDGEVTRNVGVKVLDGTENWALISGYTNLYYNEGASQIIENNATGEGVPASYCTHFKGELTTVGGVNQMLESIKVGFNYSASTRQKVYIKSNAFNSDANNLKQYLADQYNAGHPVVIIYPLATATTETVTGQPMNIQAGTNIVQITQASMDNLELEVKYKAGVSVTITEIQNAQLDDNVEVTIN